MSADLSLSTGVVDDGSTDKYAAKLKKVFGEVARDFDSLSKVINEVGKLDVAGNLKEQLKSAGTTLQSLSKQFDTLPKEMSNAMQSTAREAKKGAQGVKSAIAGGMDDSVATVRAARQKMQAEYEAMVAMGAKVKPGALANLASSGVSLFDADKKRLQDYLGNVKAASALELEAFRRSEKEKLGAESLRIKASSTEQLAADRMELEAFRRSEKEKQGIESARIKATAAEQLAADRMELDAFLRGQAQKEAQLMLAARRQVAVASNNPSGTYSSISGSTVGKTYDVGPVQRFTAAQAQLNATLRDGHSAARGLASGFGAMWLTWGNIAPLLTGAAISHSFVQMVKAGADVQHSMTQIRVLAGESAESVGRLNTQMLELARSGPFGPREIAEAFRVMALAGLSAQSASEAVQDVLNFSIAGDVGIKEAADVLTSVGTAFKIGSDGYGYIADVIAKAAAESKSSVEDFSGAMKTASVINLQYGVSLEETAVGISLLANAGIRGTAAGTALRNMYADLSGRTQDVSKVLKTLGVQALDPLTGKMRSTKDVFNDLIGALSQRTPIEAADFIKRIFSERGGKEAMAVIDALQTRSKALGTDAATMYEELAQKVANASGFAAISAAELSLTPLNQMKSVSAALQATFVETFESLQPYILQTASDLKAIFASENFRAGLQDMAVGIGNIIKFVVEWSRELVSLFLVYKAFSSVLGVMSAVAAGTTAAAAAATAAGTAFTGMSVAMRLATLANPILIGLTATVTGLAAAWAFLRVNRDDAVETVTTASNNQELIKSLEAELQHINNVNEARRQNISLMELEAIQKAKLAGAASKSAVDVLRDERDRKLDNYTRLKGKSGGVGLMNSSSEAAALTDFRQADEDFREAARKHREELGRVEELKSQIRSAHAEAAEAAKAQRPHVLGTPGTPGAPEGAAAKAQKEINDGLKLFDDLLAKDNGYTASFAEDVTKLAWAYHHSAKSAEEYAEALAILQEQQPGAARARKQNQEGLDDLIKFIEEKEAAKEAAAEYIKTAQKQAARTLDGVGKGTAYRTDQSGIYAIEDEFEKRRAALLKESQQEGRGSPWFAAQLQIAEELTADKLKSHLKGIADMRAAEKDWTNGASEAYENYLANIGNVAKSTENMFTKAFQGAEDALVKFVKTGKLDFANLADSIITDLIRIQIQQSIMPGLSAGIEAAGSWFMSLMFANGGAFQPGGIQAFANGGAFTNQIVNTPTLFKFAQGTGLMGEAGPEAIMPLTRGPNGKLGVEATGVGGGGNNMIVNIIEAPGQGGTQSRRTENGVDILDVFVEKVKNSIAGDISRGSGVVPNAMSQTYGLNRVAGAY